MMVRAKKKLPMHKTQQGEPTPKPVASESVFPAPIRGWVLNEGLATPAPGGAWILDNWVCTQDGARVRGGRRVTATLPDPVVSLFSYKSANSKRFAATATGIYDFTTVADPEVALTATVSGLTSGDYSTAQFGAAGGDYMYAVNGADEAQLYDGATFTAINAVSSPAITGVLTSDFSHVWTYANRLWFVEKDTASAWYLPVDSIGGAATEISLAGVFSRGGSLLFGAKWSLDAGDGLDDKCVFVSTEGEVAIYEGTNPASATDWRLAGIYTLPKPLGRKAYIQAGGDLLVATVSGLIPISASINTDIGAIESRAVSLKIAPFWTERASSLVGAGWEIVKAQNSGIMIVSLPDSTQANAHCLAANLATGAWSRFTGWDTQCLLEFDGSCYFGSLDSKIYLADSGGSDNGDVYTASYMGLYESLGAQGRHKEVLQLRPIFRTGSPINPQISVNADFDDTLPSPPNSVANYTADEWDSGLWDEAIWDAETAYSVRQSWVPVAGAGVFIAPTIQMSFGVTPTPRVYLVSTDAQFWVGDAVT